ncbi:MAG: phosphodiester glycosidase family protein [Armatimonadota bacterium]|jgi:exopolysaccharide biosynthesis protein
MQNRLLIASILAFIVPVSTSASSVVYEQISSGKVHGHLVTVNLADPQTRVSVAIAQGGLGKNESFKSMVSRTRPTAAITGTFFDTKSLLPTGDIAVYGKIIHSGCIGSALCIDSNNKASIVSLANGRKSAWEGYETVMCCGPALVTKGKSTVRLRQEGFGNSLYAPAARTAVGINGAGKLLLVAVSSKIRLHKMAELMVKCGAVDALTLDGGSSTGFYGGGSYRANPTRKLTNLLVVYSDSNDYNNAKTALVPASVLAKAEKKPVQTVQKIQTASVPVMISTVDSIGPVQNTDSNGKL